MGGHVKMPSVGGDGGAPLGRAPTFPVAEAHEEEVDTSVLKRTPTFPLGPGVSEVKPEVKTQAPGKGGNERKGSGGAAASVQTLLRKPQDSVLPASS